MNTQTKQEIFIDIDEHDMEKLRQTMKQHSLGKDTFWQLRIKVTAAPEDSFSAQAIELHRYGEDEKGNAIDKDFPISLD